jgi:hypothetical protein
MGVIIIIIRFKVPINRVLQNVNNVKHLERVNVGHGITQFNEQELDFVYDLAHQKNCEKDV